jgi:DNA-binding beta-propeller fold protein YncE
MSLQLSGYIELPGNLNPGGFDHAGVHCGSGRLYVAHTANDSLDVIDCVQDRYLHSIENLASVAGALVSDENNLVFTSNRGENTVGILAPDNKAGLAKIDVGIAPNRLARTLTIPAAGPHGLDFDPDHRRLFCACDANQLVILKADSGEVLTQLELSGSPDVIFFNRVLRHLYVAVGDPGVMDVFDTDVMERIETVPTEGDAHTLGFDAERNKVYAFLPKTHRAAVYVDQG